MFPPSKKAIRLLNAWLSFLISALHHIQHTFFNTYGCLFSKHNIAYCQQSVFCRQNGIFKRIFQIFRCNAFCCYSHRKQRNQIAFSACKLNTAVCNPYCIVFVYKHCLFAFFTKTYKHIAVSHCMV